MTGVVTGAQAVALIPVTVVVEPLRHAIGAWLHFGTVSIAVAVAASILGNALWNRMSRLLPLTMVGQMILFETLFALLYGFAWERRLPLPLEVVEFVLVVASVLTCITTHRRHAPSPLPITGEQFAVINVSASTIVDVADFPEARKPCLSRSTNDR
ncbi:MAG TPA: hypothetical protein VN222_09245 [Novosphingobium sp.]|nr:hypothetical protein [Novosphingobium sp.]